MNTSESQYFCVKRKRQGTLFNQRNLLVVLSSTKDLLRKMCSFNKPEIYICYFVRLWKLFSGYVFVKSKL